MTGTEQVDANPGDTGSAAATPKSSAPKTVLSGITRWILIVHAALLAAQPILAGAMLDAMSPEPQTMHRMIAMTILSLSIVQVCVVFAAWRGKSAWPKAAFTGSAVLLALEIAQFTLGHLSLGMSVHIPLGILVLVIGVFLAFKYAR